MKGGHLSRGKVPCHHPTLASHINQKKGEWAKAQTPFFCRKENRRIITIKTIIYDILYRMGLKDESTHTGFQHRMMVRHKQNNGMDWLSRGLWLDGEFFYWARRVVVPRVSCQAPGGKNRPGYSCCIESSEVK
ncbi:hypothetical protein TNCT_20941 [Trichonephila clavata]|uniref:Uncharacterized protein n=1 Tax=Trichonephila clavata TaxID=2740835 RepID=A0A8X6FL55_TRICU|nr:hypothetical protein TNCT_20941 [Trichonephila clavata]